MYLLGQDVCLEKLTYQAKEAQAANGAKEETTAMIRSGEFIPYLLSLIELLFAMRGSCGALV